MNVSPTEPIAAKNLADLAEKVKKAVPEAVPGAGTWYYMSDLTKTKKGLYDEGAWTPFDAKMQLEVENAYTMGAKDCTYEKYFIRFADMMQFHADDHSRQRPVKRM